MGTIADTAIDRRRPPPRARAGRSAAIAVTSFRPFPADRARRGRPRTARAVAVVERTDEPAAADNPLTREIKAALADVAADGVRMPRVAPCRPASARATSPPATSSPSSTALDDRRRRSASGRTRVARDPPPARARASRVDLRPAGAYSLRGHSIGGFGSVTTNKLVATLVGELFGLYVQAYPRYGSEKKGLPTTYYLTIADEPIRGHAELDRGRLRAAPRRARLRPGQPARRPRRRRHRVPPDAARPTPRRSGRRSRPAARAEILARRIRRDRARHRGARPRARAAAGPRCVRMQGVALVGVFLRVAPFAERAGLDRGAAPGGRPATRLGRFFGKRGGERRRRQPGGRRRPPTTDSST